MLVKVTHSCLQYKYIPKLVVLANTALFTPDHFSIQLHVNAIDPDCNPDGSVHLYCVVPSPIQIHYWWWSRAYEFIFCCLSIGEDVNEDCKITTEELGHIVNRSLRPELIESVQSVLMRYISELKQIYNFYR